MRDIQKASNAALNRIIWLYSDIASVPLVVSIITNEVMRNMIGIAEAIGEGSPFLGVDFANFTDVLRILIAKIQKTR